jgi:predicted amidohydrolase YtcJ
MPSSKSVVKRVVRLLHAILSTLMLVPARRVAFATFALASAAAIACSRPPRLAADLVITRASIWTGNPAQPSASAVAVIGDRIVDVGSAEEIDRWRGPGTTVVDAEGRRLVPGFNDAHARLVDGGTQLDDVDLADAGTAAEFARRINERAKAKPGEWVLGGRWDERRWTPAALPVRSLIDEVTNSSPVFVVRFDGTMALANAAAMGRAGITEQTPDPPGGVIVRGADGFPTGVFQGVAMDIIARVIPKMTPEQRLHAVRRALEQAESFGVTSVQDVGAEYEDIAAYADLANRGELTVRVYAVPAEAGWYDQAKLGVHRAFGSPSLRLGAVRATIDRGIDLEELRTRLMAADHAGLQLSIRTPGEGGVAPALDVLDAIARANGGRDRRVRLDVTRVTPADLSRLSSLNVIGVLQPDVRDATVRPLADAGLRLTLGSGWPAASLNPMLAIDAATARGLTVVEALSAYTTGSAFAEFQDGEKGSIARGKLADMAVLSDDILAIPPSRIKDIQVLTTIAGGKVVHQRKP